MFYKPLEGRRLRHKRMNVKRLFFLLLFAAAAYSAFAYDLSTVAPSGQTLYFNYSWGAMYVTPQYPNSPYYDTCPDGDLVIPSTVTYNNTVYPVISISANAFRNCTGLTSVTLPNSINQIEEYAFQGCTGLVSVNFADSVSQIGAGAFFGCTSLAAVHLPNTVTQMGNDAFSGCSGMTSLTLSSGLQTIGRYVFQGCSSLTSVTIPGNITTIDFMAFGDCTGLSSLAIPASVTSISWSFAGCSGLTSIMVDAGNPVYDSRGGCNAIVATANNELIQGCSSTIIPNTVTIIGELAFSGCSGLTTIDIPNSVTTIRGHAFGSCTGLTSVTFPNSLVEISSGAFSGCTSITSVTFSNGITSITGFDWCTSLTTVNIPPSVTYIAEDAFYSCTSLSSLPMGENVTTIGFSAFGGCTGLTSVVIPEGVTSIGSGAFFDCWNMSSLVLPSTLTWIGQSAFEYCTSLASVIIPDGISNLESTFSFCRSMTSVTLGRGITTIGYGVFWGCTALDTVTCLATTPPTLGEDVFVHSDSTSNYTIASYIDSASHLYVPCASVPAYQAANGWNTFPNCHGLNLLEVSIQDTVHGHVDVVPPTCSNPMATLTAIPDAGFYFDHWNDGNVDNPRTIAVTQDTSFGAVFLCIPNTTYDSAVACDSYMWNNETYTFDTVLVDTRYNIYGCDSSHVFQLKVNYSINGESTATSCDSYSWHNTIYTATGDYVWNKTAQHAGECDTTESLHLTIHHSGIGNEMATACDSYSWKGATYMQSGNYTFDTLTFEGCDSTVTLALTINATANVILNEHVCGEYTWRDNVYSQNGIYVFDTLTVDGCDSTVTLFLTVNLPVLSSTTENVCDSYNWYDSLYTVSGDYQHIRAAVAGECDTVDTLHLTVHYSGMGYESTSACDNYTWKGVSYTHTGNYVYDTLTTNGCDSTVTLSLTINHPVYITDSVMICEGSLFYWERNDNIYTGDTTDAFTLLGNVGECDTLIKLMLVSYHPPHTGYTVVACDSYLWNENGVTYTTSGNYIYRHSDSIYGCTQTDTLHLTLNHSVVTFDTMVLSTAEELPFEYLGEIIYAEGDYTFVGTTADGCDSNIHLFVSVSHEGIDAVDVLNVRIYQRDGCLMVEGAERMDVCVYDAVGRTLAAHSFTSPYDSSSQYGNGVQQVYAVPTTGIYLVRVGNMPVQRVCVVK